MSGLGLARRKDPLRVKPTERLENRVVSSVDRQIEGPAAAAADAERGGAPAAAILKGPEPGRDGSCAWTALIAEPARLRSLCNRPWIAKVSS